MAIVVSGGGRGPQFAVPAAPLGNHGGGYHDTLGHLGGAGLDRRRGVAKLFGLNSEL